MRDGSEIAGDAAAKPALRRVKTRGSASPVSTSLDARARLGGHYAADARYPSMTVNVTNHCNLACRHCFVFRDGNPNQAPESIKDEMDDATMLDTLTRLRDRHGVETVLWMGGEPTLRPSLLRAAVGLFRRNIVVTNGTAPLADLGPSVLYVVSMDGPRDLNDAIRGAGTYDRVLRNLGRLPAGFAAQLQVQCVVTRVNQDRLEELVQALLPTPVGWLTFSFLVPDASGANHADAWPDNAARAGAVQRVMALKRQYGGFIRNSQRSLELMLPPYAERVTAQCPAQRLVLPLYLEDDHFVTPFCCYGNDVDCARCGAWIVFHLAAEEESAGEVAWSA